MNVPLYSDWDASRLTRPEGQVGLTQPPRVTAPGAVTTAVGVFPDGAHGEARRNRRVPRPRPPVPLKDAVLGGQFMGAAARPPV